MPVRNKQEVLCLGGFWDILAERHNAVGVRETKRDRESSVGQDDLLYGVSSFQLPFKVIEFCRLDS